MKRYFIEDAKVGIDYTSCTSAAVNVSVKFKCGGKSMWLSVSEFDGIPSFFLTEEDIFDILMDDERCVELIDDTVAEVYGIDTCGGYDIIFESMYKNPENPAVSLMRYLIVLTRCSNEETDKFIKMGKGKYADELELPMSDAEEDHLCTWEDRKKYYMK